MRVKGRLISIWLIFGFALISAICITFIFAITNKNYSASVGISYNPSINVESALQFTLNSEGTKYSVSRKSTSISGDLVIPKTYNGKPVTTIASSAFTNCTGLTSITIPSSVTSIGSSAFYGCEGLTSITIPSSVTSIGTGVFNWCRALTSIQVETGNTVYHSADNCLIETSSKTLITGCKNSVIPTDGSVTSIGNSAFCYCTGLTSVLLSTNLTVIDFDAFTNCSELTSITIPARVTSIGTNPFEDCIGLTSIQVETGNTVYHSADNCLIETESKTLITGCKNSVIPTDGSVTNIGNSAFEGCRGLTSITIPSSVTSIGTSAFTNCTSLTSITIPSSVTSIGRFAFDRCSKLENVTFVNPNGWYVSDSSLITSGTSLSSADLSSTSTAAAYLELTYCMKYWYCQT